MCSILEAVLLSITPTFINIKKQEKKPYAENLEILKKDATYCTNEFELLEIINPKINPKDAKIHESIDFSGFDNYFTKEKVVPIKNNT